MTDTNLEELVAKVRMIKSPWAKPIIEVISALKAERDAALAGAVLRLSIGRKIGMYGAAYDGPYDTRAYTADHQPANQAAWSIGKAATAATKEPAGDYIDVGLNLLRHLKEQRFGVFSLVEGEALEPDPERLAAVHEMKSLLKEAAVDLTSYVNMDYPAAECAVYPDIARRHHRDLELVRKIEVALKGGEA